MKLEKLELVRKEIPLHVAIIPDGNRRWTKKKGLMSFAGHKKSAAFDNLIPLLERARDLGVRYVSFWAFSTENWSRSGKEKKYLFELIPEFISQFKEYAVENRIRFRHLGRKDRIPENVREVIRDVEEATREFDGMSVQVCLDYGGRDEIVRAVNRLVQAGKKGVSEEDISACLDTSGIPDVEMIIRTSGEKRTSGMMSFQGVYAELYFEDKFFPDFNADDLEKAIKEFGRRKRNFGK